jgi:hypothetical protein
LGRRPIYPARDGNESADSGIYQTIFITADAYCASGIEGRPNAILCDLLTASHLHGRRILFPDLEWAPGAKDE